MNNATLLSAWSRTLGRLSSPFLKDSLLHILLGIGVLLSLRQPGKLAAYVDWIDWPTILTLSGLMLLTKGIELSGYLDHLGRLIIRHLRTQRALALFLVASAALLSMLLTNDVALFIVVPLTLGLRGVVGLPVGRLVIFQALAVNAGSLLTPIGNPQNILLWQKSHLSFAAFTLQMMPLATALLVLQLVATAVVFPARAIHTDLEDASSGWNTTMLGVCAVLYVGFLVTVELDHPAWALPVVAACLLVLYREVLLEVDWSLIAVFMLMFIDVRLVTEFGAPDGWLSRLPRYPEWQVFLGGLVGSQLISNVPATILLMKYMPASKTIAYAVNAGGFGFVLGSMANLIALRMAGEKGIWLRFHLYSIPALLVSAALGYALL